MRHTAKLLGVGLTFIALSSLPRAARAQIILGTNVRTYDSLTALTQFGGTAETGTTDVTGDFPLTARGSQVTSGQAAFAARFGNGDFTNGGAQINTEGRLSTSLVADDIYLRVAANPYGGNATAFTLNTFRTLLTNENAATVNVTASVRFYLDDGVLTNGNGGFAGTLLYSADQAVTLGAGAGTGTGANASVTQVQFDFSSSPLFFNNFNTTMNNNYFEKRIWVGLFVTADAGVGAGTLNNVGSVVYDTDLSTRNSSPFQSDAPGGARSDDQFFGDDSPNIAANSPYNRSLYDYNASSAPPQVDLPGGSRFLIARTLNGTTGPSATAFGPDANLSYYFQGTTLVLPEPGSLGLWFAGAAPLGLLLARRRRAR